MVHKWMATRVSKGEADKWFKAHDIRRNNFDNTIEGMVRALSSEQQHRSLREESGRHQKRDCESGIHKKSQGNKNSKSPLPSVYPRVPFVPSAQGYWFELRLKLRAPSSIAPAPGGCKSNDRTPFDGCVSSRWQMCTGLDRNGN